MSENSDCIPFKDRHEESPNSVTQFFFYFLEIIDDEQRVSSNEHQYSKQVPVEFSIW